MSTPLVLEEVLAWTRSLPGSPRLRALVMLDEVHAFILPHPHEPPTKEPLVALLEQGRAFGVGVLLATQNPMGLDYRTLGNAGLWFLGRLETDADRARVLDGLELAGRAHRGEKGTLGAIREKLPPRWFVVRDARASGRPRFVQPRWAMSFLRGPMTWVELKRLREPGG